MPEIKVYKKGFKGFNAGLKCLEKQYAENTVFEENGGSICGAGVMHFCEAPLAVLNYYPFFQTQTNDVIPNEFAEVEALADCQQEGDKFATTKLKIGAKINFAGLCKAQIEYVKEKIKKAATTGWKAHSATTGDYAHSATTGDEAHSATTGDYAHSATTGDYAHSATTGWKAHSATTGDYAHSATTGDEAHSATTGDEAHSATTGENSISAALGQYGWAKASKGSWIVLAEYDSNGNILQVKTAKIDDVQLKANTFYKLENGEFVEAEK